MVLRSDCRDRQPDWFKTLDPQTSYITGQRYTILTATSGVNGIAPGAVSRSAFPDHALKANLEMRF